MPHAPSLKKSRIFFNFDIGNLPSDRHELFKDSLLIDSEANARALERYTKGSIAEKKWIYQSKHPFDVTVELLFLLLLVFFCYCYCYFVIKKSAYNHWLHRNLRTWVYDMVEHRRLFENHRVLKLLQNIRRRWLQIYTAGLSVAGERRAMRDFNYFTAGLAPTSPAIVRQTKGVEESTNTNLIPSGLTKSLQIARNQSQRLCGLHHM